jgi:hypothetical protein
VSSEPCTVCRLQLTNDSQLPDETLMDDGYWPMPDSEQRKANSEKQKKLPISETVFFVN